MLKNIKISRYKRDSFFLKNIIASGSEGCIVKGKDNSLLKFFYTEDEEVLENKYKKIIRLYEKDIPFLTNPISTVSCHGKFVGYGMKNETNYRSINNVCIDRKDFLIILKDIKDKLLELESEDITYTDLRLCNILLDDSNGKIKFCDVDNVMIGDLESDVLLYELSKLHLEKYPDFDIHSYMHNLLVIKECIGFRSIDFSSLSLFKTDRAVEWLIRETFSEEGLDIFRKMINVEKDPSKYSKRYMIDHLK